MLTVRILTDTIIIRNLTIERRTAMSYHKLMMENHTFFSRMVFERLSGTGLSTGQPKILEYLISHDGAIQKDIAEACAVEPATATSLLSRMEKNGLVERRSKDGDLRVSHRKRADGRSAFHRRADRAGGNRAGRFFGGGEGTAHIVSETGK